MKTRGGIAALLIGMTLVACSTKARLKTEANQVGATLELKVEVDPPASGTLTFKGHPAFEKLGPQKVELGHTLALSVPLGGVPSGKNSITMHFEGKGKGLAKEVKADRTLAFDRKAATPELRRSSGRARRPVMRASVRLEARRRRGSVDTCVALSSFS